ncbi:MAG: hypothetical protein ACREIB_09940, partial [Pseudomonadota bacterium]
GNTEAGDGYLFRGRGYVQLTGRPNYMKAGRLLGVDLIGNPELALEPDIAGKIIVDGMMQGWFTARALPQYVNTSKVDFREARRVVNGLDKADLIAGLALAFERAIYAGAPVAAAPAPVRVAAAPTIPDDWWSRVKQWWSA